MRSPAFFISGKDLPAAARGFAPKRLVADAWAKVEFTASRRLEGQISAR
jgi:hypothetical protein